MKEKIALKFKIIGKLIWLVIKFIFHTTKWQIINKEDHEEAMKLKNPLLIFFWHHKSIIMPCLLKKKSMFYTISSKHKDGFIAVETLKCFNPNYIGTIWGSSNKGSTNAIRGIKKMIDDHNGKCALAVTPDGPKGPNMKFKNDTLLIMAKKYNMDILLVSYDVKKKKILRSWDKLIIPMPFNEGILMYKFMTHKTHILHNDAKNIIENELNDMNKYCEERTKR